MPVFRCLMRGENFPGSVAGQSEPVGFYTTRFVEAATASEAEMAALTVLREDPTFSAVPPRDRTDAQVYFEQIEEVPLAEGRSPGKGFTFFPMDT